MSRHLKSWVTLLILSLASPALSWAQTAPQKSASPQPAAPSPGAQPKMPAKPPQPETDQTTNIPYFTLRDGLTSTLTLQNAAPTPTPVTVTIYNLEGKSQVLEPITLDPHSFRELDLAGIAKGQDFDSGNIQVAFHGISMVVTCQVSVSDVAKRVSFESREQDMMDFESTISNGILSLPQKEAQGFLAITNVSKNKVTARVTLGEKMKEIDLYSRETRLVKLNEEFGLHAPAAALVKLSQNGLSGDIITTGFVMDLNAVHSGWARRANQSFRGNCA